MTRTQEKKQSVFTLREDADSTVFYLTQEEDLEEDARQMALLLHAARCSLVTVPVRDWNRELSPWEAPPVFGARAFGKDRKGAACDTSGILARGAVRAVGMYPDGCLFGDRRRLSVRLVPGVRGIPCGASRTGAGGLSESGRQGSQDAQSRDGARRGRDPGGRRKTRRTGDPACAGMESGKSFSGSAGTHGEGDPVDAGTDQETRGLRR